MILHLTIRFLDPRYHGRGDGGESEWPPSPFRVFQALLAGAVARWSDDRAAAFRWLERLDPPVIYALPARRAAATLTYVPNNNNSDPRSINRTPKLIQPRALPDRHPHAEYLWHFDASGEALRHAETIAECARHLQCLGWGIDMAVGCGRISEGHPGPEDGFEVYVPSATPGVGGATARVPGPGSLESLERAHTAFLERIRTNPATNTVEIHDQPGAVRFATAVYGPSPGRPFCAFELTSPGDPDDRTSVSPRNIKALVGMLRGALGSKPVRAALGSDVVDQMILGHPTETDGPRLSILPLLSVGHRHADARVRRVILAGPFGGSGDVCRALAEVLNGQPLKPADPNAQPVAQLVRLPYDDAYVRRWYAGAGLGWASVSPVLLPGFDRRTDRRGGRDRPQSGQATFSRAEALVLKALAHAGVALPCRVELSGVSWWPGVPHARDFVPREKLGPAPRYHVKLTFDQPFAGPLSLGRQRHMGLGVFACLDSNDSQNKG